MALKPDLEEECDLGHSHGNGRSQWRERDKERQDVARGALWTGSDKARNDCLEPGELGEGWSQAGEM